MSNFLKQEFGVAMSGVKWDSGNFKLWQSTTPNVILFSPKQPVLAKNERDRYQFGISQFRQQVDGTFKITGGSAIFTITSAIQFTQAELERLKEEWISEMPPEIRSQYSNTPRFIPLNIRNGTAQVLINSASGVPDEAHSDTQIGTPGGTNSFLVSLTELGAQEWVSGIKEKSVIPVGVKMQYEYLRMLPTIGAHVRVHGKRLFTHLSSELNVSVKGFWYGGSAKISAAWEKMTRNGDVEITFEGTGLSPELEELRQELVTTFAEQAQQQLFDSLFQPMPEVEDAKAGSTGGFFGGANFALKWKKVEEATDLELTLKFKGWTWLKASMDAELTSLISELDDSYINEVNAQISSPASIVVDADPLLENVAVSWSASEGKGPESPVFGSLGGNEIYTVTSQQINDVRLNWNAKVNFAPPNWPVIETSGTGLVKEGANQVVIKPSSWVGRHLIFFFVRDGEFIMPPSDNDYLVCNVSFSGPHLTHPIRASARITPFAPLEFSYPLSPERNKGTAKFSAFGVVNGRFVRSKTQQTIGFDEEAVFILASTQGDIQLVSQNTVFPENMPANSLEKTLLEAKARPIVISGNGTSVGGYRDGTTSESPQSIGRLLKGTVVAVQYSKDGPALVVESMSGRRTIAKLHDNEDAEPFNDGKRRQVEIEMGTGNFAESIAVIL